MPKVVIIKRLLVDYSIIIRPSIIKPNRPKLSAFFNLSVSISLSLCLIKKIIGIVID
jgi:hypothetical protein